MTTERRPIEVTELADFVEVGSCGTAAVITPIGSIVYGDTKYTFGDENVAGPVLTKLYKQLQGIQYGDVEDTHGWMVRLA